jgi:hypothetical protein
MAYLKSGRRVSPRRQALRALRNAETRAAQKTSDREALLTLQRGCETARSWLDGTHPKLAQ